MIDIKENIMKDIKKTFGDFNQPNYKIIGERYFGNYYKELIDDLRKLFLVEDWSDIDTDNCLSFYLIKSNFKISLDLSLVGKYSLLIRNFGDLNKMQILSKTFTEINHLESKIVNILKKHKVLLLDREILCQKIHFVPCNEELEEVYIYQVLFSTEYIKL